MTFPDYLTNGYNLAKQSKLVAGDTSAEALAEFAQILRQSRPPTGIDCPSFDTVQTLFRTNRRGYIACIRNTTNEHTVMWTEPRAIVSWFDLSRRVYIKADRNGAFVVRTISQDDRAPSRRPVRKADDLPLVDFPTLNGDEIVMGGHGSIST